MDPLCEEVAACAARTLGFRGDALEPRAVRRAAQRLRAIGSSDRDLIDLCERDAPAVVGPIVEEVTVDETYFFRGPDQFELVASLARRPRLASGAPVLRGWSAGCASGAEAYSLAATLRAAASAGVEVEVLGTDVVGRNVDRARQATYDGSSVRGSGPMLFPALTEEGPDLRVASHVRPLVTFSVHNLLDPPPLEAYFDFVLCRSVLVYMTADAKDRVCRNLARALAPGGILVLAPGDLVDLPGVLSPVAAPELAAYGHRREAAPRRTPTARGTLRRDRVAATSGASPTLSRDVVALHLEALARIERGDDAAADRALDRLLGLDDGYLPGIVERALLLNRRGDAGAAARMMADVLRRSAHLPSEAPIAGPCELPLSFYRQSAEAFLERRRAPR